jgi:hypothetical protein
MKQLLYLTPFFGTVLVGLRQLFFPSLCPVLFFFLYFFVIIFLPGIALAELTLKRDRYDLAEWTALSFSLGLAALTPPVLAAYILKTPADNLFFCLFFFFSLPSSLFLLSRRSKSMAQAITRPRAYEYDFQKTVWCLFWFVVGLAAARDFLFFERIPPTGDIYYDWAEITKYLVSSQNYGLNPHIKGIYTTAMHLYQIPILLVTGLIKFSNGIKPYAANAYLFPLSELIGICASYFFLSSLFRNKSLVIFILFLKLWIPLELSSLVGIWTETIFLVALGLVFRRLNFEGRSELIWAVILSAVLFMFRVTIFSHYFILLTLFAGASLLFNFRDRKTLRILLQIIAGGFVLSLPLIYIKFSHPAMGAFQVSDKFNPNRLIRIGWAMFYINPLDYVYHYYHRLIALAISPWLLTYRKKPWALFLFASIVIPPFIQFVPPLATSVSHFLSYLFVWKIVGLQIGADLVLKAGLFLVLIQLSLHSLKIKLPSGWLSKSLPLLIGGVIFVIIVLASRSLVNFVVGNPEFRANLRSRFISSGLELLWIHKHLLLGVLPFLLWIIIAVIWELRSQRFSSKAGHSFFQELESSSGRIPIILALIFAYAAFFYNTDSFAKEKSRCGEPIYRSLEDRLGPLPGMRYLQSSVQKPAVVLADPEESYILPAYCDHYVYAVYARRFGGQMKTESLDIQARLDFVDSLLKGKEEISEEQFRFLQKNGISFIYLTRDITPVEAFARFDSCTKYFRKSFESPVDAVYEVRFSQVLEK